MVRLLVIAALVALVGAQCVLCLVDAQDPCTVASASPWVSAKQAHACELNVPFDKNRSLAVVDSAIKALQYYSLETWFIKSPNPLIPHHVNIRSLLTDVQKKTASSGYATDWDFNTAVTDAFNQEADGHTIFEAACTVSFSWNLPFSIATLAKTPFDRVAFPTFLVNYDFQNQNRPGLEDYYKGLGIDVRPFDGARILEINDIDASSHLVDLAQRSNIKDGLFGAYEDVNPRYMRLMSRYSADTVSGAYTQEIGRFGQRVYFPGRLEEKLLLQLQNGKKVTLTVPWAAQFLGAGNDTASFIAETCLVPSDAAVTRRARELEKRRPAKRDDGITLPHPLLQRIQAIEKLDIQDKVRQTAVSSNARAPANNIVTPNLTTIAHFVTLDLYQLKQNPKVGVVYFEQFEPSDGTDFLTYFNGVSNTLFDGLNAMKAAGIEKVIIDQSGNRGGFIFAGAISLWSLWPKDLYPGFPAVFRDLDLTRRESDQAASTNDQSSEYNFRFYRDLNYTLLTSNAQFLDPPVPQTINGVPDAYSHRFFDDFGDNSSAVTSFVDPPFAAEDYVIVANGICASTCSIFSSYLFQKHGIRSAVFGGTPSTPANPNPQMDGGVKGSEVTDFSTVLFELELAGLQNDPNAPQPFPIQTTLSLNYRNAIPYVHQEDGILEFVYESATKKFQFTPETVNKPELVWEFVAEQFFPNL